MKTTKEKIQVLEDMRWNGYVNWDMELLDMLAKDVDPKVRAVVATYGRSEDKMTFFHDNDKDVQLVYLENASYDDMMVFLDSNNPQVSSYARVALRNAQDEMSAWAN